MILRQSVADGHVDVKKISSQITDESEDVKKISGQISKLIAKVELAAKCNNAGSNFLHFDKAPVTGYPEQGTKGWLGSPGLWDLLLGGAP